MKLLFDESLSPKLVDLLRDLFPESESALRNRLHSLFHLYLRRVAQRGEAAYATGNSITTSRPGCAFLARIAPLCNSLARRAMERPRPMPPLDRLRSLSTR